jgi:hypothetical protein
VKTTSPKISKASRRKSGPSPREATVSIQFMLVSFPEQRAVQANGTNVGFTNHTLMLPADQYNVTLAEDGYAPQSQDVVLAGTAVMKPLVVIFNKASD